MTESVALRPNISFSLKYDNDVNKKLKKNKKVCRNIEDWRTEDWRLLKLVRGNSAWKQNKQARKKADVESLR